MKVTKKIEPDKRTFYKINTLTWRTSLYNKPDKIEKINRSIREAKNKLDDIKENSIKDFIYSNRQIPSRWKGKLDYNEQVRKMLANDDAFLAYLGNMYKNQKVRKKIGDIRLYSNKITTKKENETKKIRKFQLFRNKTMDERDVDNYFKKLEKSYPIKGKLNELFDKKILESLNNKNKININKNIKKRLKFEFLKINKMKNDINNNIYSNLVSKKSRNDDDLVIHRSQSAINRHNKKEILKDNNTKRKIILKNPYAMKQLESINFFGPYYSYCSKCGEKNTNFYKNIDSETLIEIIKQIQNNKDEQILKKLKSKKIEVKK